MSKVTEQRRVVVTGQGVVSPVGTGVEKFWNALKKGETGIAPITFYEVTDDLRCKLAGEVKDFDVQEDVGNIDVVRADRFSQLAAKAAMEAVEQSGLKDILAKDGSRAACIIGSGSGGLTTLETGYRDLYRDKIMRTNPLTLLRTLGSSAAAHVSMMFNITGPTFGVVSACATGSHAMGLVYQMIKYGQIDAGIAGGSEASLNWGAQRSWEALFVLSNSGCFPFSKKRNGTILAEGSGIMVLEDYEHAKARGANILAEVMGFGMTADAGDMVHPKVEGAAGAMQLALDDAGLKAEQIDYINAHGTATKTNDVTETNAIKAVFGEAAGKVAISSTKSMHGHMLGGGSLVEGAACIKAIHDNFIPPTINLDDPDPECDLDYTPNKGVEREVTYTMNNSLAFGGLNTVAIFGPAPK